MGGLKKHFQDHRELYLGIAIGLGLAGITYTIVKGCYATVPRVVDGPKTADISVTIRPFTIFSSPHNEIVTVLHSGTRGHPGFRIRNIETGKEFLSQNEAAKAFNISPSNLSSHLNGKYNEVEGYHFERI
jgi:hypothetical protein